jgi:hypothetical protein
MSSMPSTAAASEIVSGLITLSDATDCGVATVGPMSAGATPGASNSTVTCVGALTWPGVTRANSSSRLCGLATMPVTFLVTPPAVQELSTVRWKSEATPLVTATWPAPAGNCPLISESIGAPNGPCGFWARRL